MSRKFSTDLPDTTPSECTIAPHYYKWDGTGKESNPNAPGYREWLKSVPYQKGDVVYLELDGKAVRARILDVYIDRDYYGDKREQYKVQIETKSDRWARKFFYTCSGFVQRGYKLAGLAPEMPK